MKGTKSTKKLIGPGAVFTDRSGAGSVYFATVDSPVNNRIILTRDYDKV